MKRTKQFLVLLILCCLGVSVGVSAQDNLQIRKVFEKYGDRKGVTMVELSDEALEGYDFSLFKSITINNDSQAADFIRACLAQDESGAKKVKQVVSNGIPTSIFLQLPPKHQLFRLILFNETFKPEQKTTLIYIESKKDSEDVLKLILKKK
ncbi:MAG: hypothetical protein PHH37_11815 [Paludibacter sp.]|nr:hypothetical protein [Paludibacter sp.]